MWKKIKSFFSKLKPSKRKLIQVYAALLFNANMKGFVTGDIYKGDSKSICVPGMNCYSCPGAIGACPLGSLQNALSESKTRAPHYIIGIILLYCIILGRTICGFLCPAGLLQELLYKIKTPKLKKNKITRICSYFKYVLLVGLVIAIPLIYGLQKNNIPVPAFCKYICPIGTFEGAGFLLANSNNSSFFGMLGSIFTWKFFLLVVIILASIFIFRFFCRFLCPLGALYGIFNKIAILGIKVDKTKCDNCGACVNNCKMDVKKVGDHECIMCGECKDVCHTNAISWRLIGNKIKQEIESEEVEVIDSNVAANGSDGIDSDSVSMASEEPTIASETNVEEEVKLNPIKNKSKKKIPTRRVISIASTVLAIVVLVGVYIYYGTRTMVLGLNDVCNSLEVALVSDDSMYTIKNDKSTKVLFFYDSYDEESFETLNHYAEEMKDDDLTILAISSYEFRENEYIEKYKDSNIKFAYDSKNFSANKLFSKEPNYSLSIALSSTNSIFVKTENLTARNFVVSIIPVVGGITIGNEVGNLCPDLSVQIIDSDKSFSVLDNLGKVTVINFWGTWCTPCVQEIPHFLEVTNKYSDEVTLLEIHDEGNFETVKYISQLNNWERFGIDKAVWAIDSKGDITFKALGGESTYPRTVIVDQYGFIQFVIDGLLTKEELEDEILGLI